MRVVFFLTFLSVVSAFSTKISTKQSTSLKAGYVPDGMTPEQYRRLRDKESTENSKKKFGAFGPQSFQSRSLKSFQTELEKGKTKHLMPMTNAKKKLSQGKIRQGDIPYMQRMGSWDDSDIGKKKKWNEDDKKYNQNFSPNKLNWKEGFQPQARGGEKTDSAPKKTFFGLF